MRASPPKTPSRRLYIFAVLLFLWILIICFRLVRLQVVKYGDFVQRADAPAEPHHSRRAAPWQHLRPQRLCAGDVD